MTFMRWGNAEDALVGMAEMGRRLESTFPRHTQNGADRLAQERARPREAKLEIKRLGSGSDLIPEKTLDLPRRYADAKGYLPRIQRVCDRSFHDLYYFDQFRAVNTVVRVQLDALMVRLIANLRMYKLLGNGDGYFRHRRRADKMQHHIERCGTPGAGKDFSVHDVQIPA